MLKLKSKEEILKQYVSRYPELDRQFMNRLSEEYDRYIEVLKDVNSIEEYNKVFEEEIRENERRYKDNAMLRGLEDSPYNQYMEILAHYGLIVFFRDNMLDLS
ncbi:hypothetical protein SAMN05660462_00774 [Proteiniborus ethanoligenes]|uniref:Control of competence regulator ComK, YlbF/YmcA n=1 Tax=Proteiniborus ethanoligenes TaxID=415015 RepID=A0A1H3MC15_9FIRM|nr:hypothetical protein [Proteiniborus ethanoligenes]SDY73838.1 hypothetical protein SAMN05660462_00774 [Proteiniborus ethanoligenes]